MIIIAHMLAYCTTRVDSTMENNLGYFSSFAVYA